MDPAAARAMREQLQGRMRVLDANRADRLSMSGDQDVHFEQWQERAALGWMQNNEKNGRSVEEESVYLLLDSAVRDASAYPNSSFFRATLAQPLTGVVRAELIQASIPLTEKNVNANTRLLRYSFSPHGAGDVATVAVPVGAYTGVALALELQTQLNLDWHAARVSGATNTMNFATGFLVDGAGAREATIDQFRVQFSVFRRAFTFQVTDGADQPVAAQFALHAQLAAEGAGLATERTDDLYDVLGFGRQRLADNAGGQYAPATRTFYVLSDAEDPDFGAAAGELDARAAHSLHSNQSADMRGNVAVMVDIAPFNDNDIAHVEDTGSGTQAMRDYFAIILMRPAAFANDGSFDICNNSYPMRRHFREGLETVKNLTVAMRRPDGSLVDFGNMNYILTLRLTVRRVQPAKPMFGR
jgi:hypothetical protein